MASEPVRSTAVVAAPKDYSIPTAQQIRLLSVTASYIDNGAASNWLPAVEILDNNGNVLCLAVDQGVTVTAGSNAEVSFFPGVKHGGGTGVTSISIVSFAVFAPAAGFVQITSTNSASPTNVVTSPALVADGATTYRIDFCVAAVDISVTGSGTGTALLLTLTRDTTVLGDIVDYNVVPTNGVYGSIPVSVSVFDTPPAGTHTYSIGGFRSLSGGATSTSFVYGSNLGPPFVGVTHPGFLAILQAKFV